ncbi:hypothetical protein [Saccharospirillum salsuginis]|uniref:MSHA biogenesis protein MshI n=1 Tax=Saccharospirillum salsuginis TaxID=418750 RepID=A0A918K2M9_9GAMM|nr:hypothetical protein [Saccharospirillum salsuginis]GGX45015.1 hypothetical protein GCM10007392_09780 [Saccharospirillum salsuginis]
MGLLSPIRRNKRQQWIYLTEEGIGRASFQSSANAMPRLHRFDWKVESDAVNRPGELAGWAAEKASGPVNLLLGEGLYQMLMVDVPDVPAEEIESALRLKSADLISYDIEDATLDVILLPTDAYRGRLRMAFVIAAMKSPLRQWALELAKRGLTLNVIDVDQLQLRNLAIRSQQRHQSGLLHLGPDRCRLVLLYENELVLSRQFDIGYQSLGMSGPDEPALTLEGQDDIQLESLVLELRRSFDYYESQLGLGSIGEVSLIGWPGDVGLTASLGEKLGVRFQPLRAEDLILLPDPLEGVVPDPLIPMLGTAFRGVAV